MLRVSQIFRHVDDNGAGATCRGDVKCLFDNAWNIFSPLHHEGVLNDGPRDTDHIGFLKRVLTNQVALHLTRDYHHGNGVHVSRRDASNGIGRARA